MKLLIKLVGGLVVLLVVVAVAILFAIDAVAKGAVERGATYALGVETTLGSADVGIRRGEFGMEGLRVANPEGFTSDHFLTLGSGEVAVSLGTLRQETVELTRLMLSTIDLRLEKSAAGSNYGVIIDHLKGLRSESQDDSAPDSDSGKLFVIREVLISDVNVEVELAPGGAALTRVQVPIDEVRLTDVGTGGGTKRGVRLSELTEVIVQALLSAVASNAADFPADLVNDLGGSLQGLDSLAALGIDASFKSGDEIISLVDEEAVKTLQEATDVGEDLADEIGKTIDGIGELFGGKKKNDG
jgi:hypothetical protein